MAWLAVDEDGEEVKFLIKPHRHFNGIIWLWSIRGRGIREGLPSGSIEKLIEKKLTWHDKPVEIPD